MKCIYVALNQMSAPGVDFLKGTKQDTADGTCLSWTSVKRSVKCVCVCVHTGLLPATLPLKTRSHLNLLLVNAGHLEFFGTWSYKKVPERLKEGRGSLSFSFCTLHREVMGLSRADSGTSFCEFHTKEQIMDTGRERRRGLGRWNIS